MEQRVQLKPFCRPTYIYIHEFVSSVKYVSLQEYMSRNNLRGQVIIIIMKAHLHPSHEPGKLHENRTSHPRGSPSSAFFARFSSSFFSSHFPLPSKLPTLNTTQFGQQRCSHCGRLYSFCLDISIACRLQDFGLYSYICSVHFLPFCLLL